MSKEEIIEEMQIKLNHKFDLFMQVTINDAKIYIVPSESEIPKLKLVNYDKKSDVLRIMFESTSAPKYESVDGGVFTYIKDQQDDLIGFQLSKIKELGKESLFKLLLKVIKYEYGKLDEKELTNNNATVSIHNNFTKRKLHFFKDVIKDQYDELIQA